jgi:hypothetical protein
MISDNKTLKYGFKTLRQKNQDLCLLANDQHSKIVHLAGTVDEKEQREKQMMQKINS